jgi:dsRNA-specific ribonuclease
MIEELRTLGKGTSRQRAEQEAAKAMLDKLEE